MIKPVAILINGLLMYQPGAVSPLAPLAAKLEAHGWEVCIDTHFLTRCRGLKPKLIVGHSQGGSAALQLARSHRDAVVVTFDAVRMGPCPARRCINFRTPGYPAVPGGENIPVFAGHASMVYRTDLQTKVLAFAENAYGQSEDTRTAGIHRIDASDGTDRSAASKRRTKANHKRVAKAKRSPRELPVKHEAKVTSPIHRDEGCNFACRWEEAELIYTIAEPDWSIETLCALVRHPNPKVCP